jgi:hypothetical protein
LQLLQAWNRVSRLPSPWMLVADELAASDDKAEFDFTGLG